VQLDGALPPAVTKRPADGVKTDMILEKAEDLARLLLKQTGNLDRLEEEFAVVERALGLEAGRDMPWGERLARLRRNCGDAHPYAQGYEGHQVCAEKKMRQRRQ
jgi:hypothetical protein